jgi:hypothetical protein
MMPCRDTKATTNRRPVRAAIALFLICCCTLLCVPRARADESPSFPYERAKKALLTYLKNTGEKDVFLIGYRRVNSTEAELYYLIRDTYVGPMKVLLLATDSGPRWYVMSNPPLPVE